LFIAGVVGISAWWLMGYSRDLDTSSTRLSHSLVFLIGLLAFALGVAPYLLTGYVPVWKYGPVARIYSSGVFGVVGILCWFLPRRGRLWPVVRLVAAVWVGIMALFPITSRYDLQYVSRLREQFFTDLITQAPQLKAGTTLVLIDAYMEIGQAQTIAGSTHFSRIFYDPSIEAVNVIPRTYTNGISAIINSKGIQISANVYRSLDTVVILQRQGDHLVLVDCLQADAEQSISWGEGISEVCTNKDRIIPDPEGKTLANLRHLHLLPEVPPLASS
jgi:hypothetical protein